ncbi:MAG TPA: diacylglycerol kinase family protein [Methylomirabilota bacterium]|nr:diacylglycerol kinase family protein [Methylomirabilota bacterium]
MTRALAVVNPAAGGGRTGHGWPRLQKTLGATLAIDCALTAGPGDGERLAREAAAAGAPLVVSVGGDGTLNEVINGVLASGTPATVGAVLTGRGRDACRNFGVPRDPRAAVRALADGRDARFDLGLAQWADGRRRWFAISAGAGFDAAVARRAAGFKTRGSVPYVIAVVASLRAHRPVLATLEIDGAAEPATPVTAIVVANARYFGGGMKIAPGADPADGLLDVVVLGALGRLELLWWLPTIFSGRHLAHPRIHVRRARRVRVDAAEALPTQVDGETGGTTPWELSLVPGALRLRVPRGA